MRSCWRKAGCMRACRPTPEAGAALSSFNRRALVPCRPPCGRRRRRWQSPVRRTGPAPAGLFQACRTPADRPMPAGRAARRGWRVRPARHELPSCAPMRLSPRLGQTTAAWARVVLGLPASCLIRSLFYNYRKELIDFACYIVFNYKASTIKGFPCNSGRTQVSATAFQQNLLLFVL